MADESTKFTVAGQDGQPHTIVGLSAMKAYLADGGLDRLMPNAALPWRAVPQLPAPQPLIELEQE